MSSSVFIEHSPERRNNDEEADKAADDAGLNKDADLVVVYGKNGVNINTDDLETLIEEKAVKSISVIRISSPTPSMKDAEEAAKLEEAKRKEENGSSSDDDGNDSGAELPSDAEGASAVSDQDGSEDKKKEGSKSADELSDKNDSAGNSDDDPDKSVKAPKRRGRRRNIKLRNKQILNKSKKVPKSRSEVLGLTVENFYDSEDANRIVKEVLKMAGLSTIKRTPELEFQLYVIQNDHCYTTYTSPEQMKAAKLAAKKIQAKLQEQEAAAGASTPSDRNSPKLQILKKKPLVYPTPPNKNIKQISRAPPDQAKISAIQKGRRVLMNQKSTESEAKEKSRQPSTEEEEEYEILSVTDEDSLNDDDLSDDINSEDIESENDRDSDLDFKVTNTGQQQKRKGMRRKLLLQKAQRVNASKALQIKSKQRDVKPQSQYIATSKPTNPTEKYAGPTFMPGKSSTPQQQTPKVRILNSEMGARHVRIPHVVTNISSKPKATPNSNAENPGNPQGKNPNSPKTFQKRESPLPVAKAGGVLLKQTTLGSTTIIKRSPIVQTVNQKPTSVNNPVTPTESSTPIKEFVISKVMKSPKGVFTELTSLMSESDGKKPTSGRATPIKTIAAKAVQPCPSLVQRIIKTPIEVKSDKSSPDSQHSLSTTKGFMRIDADSKNQLPAQISVQTHISSSELAAEQDKQLDLIDAIVKDKLQADDKSARTDSDLVSSASAATPSTIDENIPKIVKMLEESTNSAAMVENKSINQSGSQQMNLTGQLHTPNNTSLLTLGPEEKPPILPHMEGASTSAHAVEDMEMTNDIPEDLLQQVVELLNEDKTFQAEVEKQIFIGGHGGGGADGLHADNVAMMPQVHQQPDFNKSIHSNILQTPPSQSIIKDSFCSIDPMKIATSKPTTPTVIKRKDGRTITLPPIEAPTTRAKRRAQAHPTSNSSLVASLNESSLDNISNSSFSMDNAASSSYVEASKSITTPGTRSVRNSTDSMSSNITTATTLSSTKTSAKKTTAARKSVAKKTAVAANKGQDSDASHAQDDDDPNKLWCICRQPHNNRFMICCDMCEDWFHGTCVNITKAMGREMEQKGVDWTCPQCVKKQQEKTQPKITDMLVPKPNVSSEPTTPVPSLNKKLTGDPRKSLLALSAATPNSSPKPPTVAAETPKTSVQKKLNISEVVEIKKPVGSVQSPSVAKPNVSLQIAKQRKSAASGNVKTVESGQSSNSAPSSNSNNPCVVCKRNSKSNSVYCSDDCIRKHVTTIVSAYTTKAPNTEHLDGGIPQIISPPIIDDKKKKARGLFEDQLSMADYKPKIERVTVYERKSGRILSGNQAPTTINLKRWIQEHPTYEAVQPGSTLAAELDKKLKEQPLNPQQQSPQLTFVKVTPHKSSPDGKPETVTSPEHMAPGGQRTLKQIIEDHKHLSSPRPGTPKQLKKYPQQVQIKPDSTSPGVDDDGASKNKKRQVLKKQSSDAGGSTGSSHKKATDSPTPSSSDVDSTRSHARNMLKENIKQRINETADNTNPNVLNKLTEEEIDQFVKETEEELYKLFNCEAGSKYKIKLRSLVFNVKDSKNHTLIAKICNKIIEPKHFVRMTPEELASQELAEWRAQENKHQLEMIKKSELDLLSCTKQYVFKNHKGEEVLEDEEVEHVNLDRTIPVEDVVKVLNNSTQSDEPDADDFQNASASDKKEERRCFDFGKEKSRGPEKSAKDGKHKDAISSHGQESKDRDSRSHRHKSKDRHRDKSRSRRSRSRSRSDSQSRSSSHGKDERRHKKHKSERHDGEKDESTKGHRDSRRERSRSRSRRARSKSHGRDSPKSRTSDKGHERSKSSGDKRSHHDRSGSREDRRDTHREHSRSHGKDLNRARSKSRGPELKDKKAKDSPQQHTDSIVSTTATKAKTSTSNSVEAVNLIDQILESTKTIEEAANLLPENKKKDKIPDAVPNAAAKNKNVSTTLSDSDQEPSSTVCIPTPPQDPYLKYVADNDEEPTIYEDPIMQKEYDLRMGFWSGRLNMIDVTRMQIILQPVVGSCLHLDKLLPDHLEVVGRIVPDSVWDYISKVKKAFNKDIILVRFIPENENETAAYVTLFEYLHTRNRLGVIRSTYPQIKDFYIYPLAAGATLPVILQPNEPVDFLDDPYRPDIMMGIIVRVNNKRIPPATPSTSHYSSSSSLGTAKIPPLPTENVKKSRRSGMADSFTPPGSPKRKKYSSKRSDLDIDAIIKAPISSKPHKGSIAATLAEADEPYSPGGSSDEDMLTNIPQSQQSASVSCQSTLTVIAKGPIAATLAEDSDLQRKMDEINQRIAAQEMEIAGLLSADAANFSDPSSTAAAAAANVLAKISIPSNLSQILASIKSKTPIPPPPPPPPAMNLYEEAMKSADFAQSDLRKRNVTPMEVDESEEYNPEGPVGYEACYKPSVKTFDSDIPTPSSSSAGGTSSGGSRLAQLTEEELLSMVPDEIMNAKPPPSKKDYYSEPPPPGV